MRGYAFTYGNRLGHIGIKGIAVNPQKHSCPSEAGTLISVAEGMVAYNATKQHGCENVNILGLLIIAVK